MLTAKDNMIESAEYFENFYESSLCGFVTIDANGVVLRSNQFFAAMLDQSNVALKQKRLLDFLSIGSKVFWETHLMPLLKMQGHFEEAALEFKLPTDQRIQVLVNAHVQKINDTETELFHLIVFRATDRHSYEQNLRHEKNLAEDNLSDEKALSALREQFIAVLGHDLRNPLGAILGGVQILKGSNFSGREGLIVTMLQSSAKRMEELIGNIMDFARARMGSGLSLDIETVDLGLSLIHVIDELKTIFPNKKIESHIPHSLIVSCDKNRVAQLFSNLLANALTHGSNDLPVQVHAHNEGSQFILSVSNGGTPIPADKIDRLFEPFTREADSPSQQGLGLGLFISSEIAKAHRGTLTATSSDEETCFTLKMPAVS